MTKTETETARQHADRNEYYKKCLAKNPGNNRGTHSQYRGNWEQRGPGIFN